MTDRPASIRAIFLLTCFKIVLAWSFFAVAMSGVALPVDAAPIGYTATAYVVLAIPTFFFIHQRNALGVRACIVLAILASIPVGAVIAMVIDVIALSLTFREPAKQFFARSIPAGAR